MGVEPVPGRRDCASGGCAERPGKPPEPLHRDRPPGVEGLSVDYHRNLLALNGTESGTLKFEDVFVPSEDVLSDNIEAFLRDVTAPFLLVQSSFCLGLAAGALQELLSTWTSPRVCSVRSSR